ncbi:IclR family transcriptional regulator [Proteocatella sphenisci]|uniref:IclR family transcriptional regulator n=1 Tax=Proteocatella sphenisci TaxID=181070 RepID=UPI00056BB7D4|nr:IclR family transcriptional regulator [Proteocatella sphenisci]
MVSTGRIQSIERAISIMDCFSKNSRELKLAEISDETGINKSTVHGILSTLKYHGFIGQDEKTQKYRLGLELLKYGDLVLGSIDISDIAKPVICMLSRTIGETVHIGISDGEEIVYILKAEPEDSIKISATIGSRNPLYLTADGRVILAHMDLDKIKSYIPENIKKSTENTVTDREQLIKDLEEIRKNGYAIDNEEIMEGIVCIAAPIFDHSGEAKYGMSILGPSSRLTGEKLKECIELIKIKTREISYEIGYKG